jgi:hypothetical protein
LESEDAPESWNKNSLFNEISSIFSKPITGVLNIFINAGEESLGQGLLLIAGTPFLYLTLVYFSIKNLAPNFQSNSVKLTD